MTDPWLLERIENERATILAARKQIVEFQGGGFRRYMSSGGQPMEDITARATRALEARIAQSSGLIRLYQTG